MKATKPIAVSERELQIRELCQQVQHLKAGLVAGTENRETDRWIFDSMENDLCAEIEGLMLKIKILQAENADLLRQLGEALDAKKLAIAQNSINFSDGDEKITSTGRKMTKKGGGLPINYIFEVNFTEGSGFVQR